MDHAFNIGSDGIRGSLPVVLVVAVRVAGGLVGGVNGSGFSPIVRIVVYTRKTLANARVISPIRIRIVLGSTTIEREARG